MFDMKNALYKFQLLVLLLAESKKMNHLTLMPKCLTNFSKGEECSLNTPSKDDLRVSSFNVIFGIIALLSVLSNSFLCMAICKHRFFRLKTYNILVLSLAATDMLTGLY